MLFISKIYAGSVGLDTGPDKLAPATGMPLISVLTENLYPDATIAFLSERLERGCGRCKDATTAHAGARSDVGTTGNYLHDA